MPSARWHEACGNKEELFHAARAFGVPFLQMLRRRGSQKAASAVGNDDDSLASSDQRCNHGADARHVIVQSRVSG